MSLTSKVIKTALWVTGQASLSALRSIPSDHRERTADNRTKPATGTPSNSWGELGKLLSVEINPDDRSTCKPFSYLKFSGLAAGWCVQPRTAIPLEVIRSRDLQLVRLANQDTVLELDGVKYRVNYVNRGG